MKITHKTRNYLCAIFLLTPALTLSLQAADTPAEALTESGLYEYTMTEDWDGKVGTLTKRGYTFTLDGDGNSITNESDDTFAFFIYGSSTSGIASLNLKNITISGFKYTTYGLYGTIALDNTTVTGNNSTSTSYSAGININHYSSITNSIFSNNNTTSSSVAQGGALKVNTSTTFEALTTVGSITDCTFTNNCLTGSFSAYGGAIYIATSDADSSDGIAESVINGTFTNNSVTSDDNALGGAICLQGGEYKEISGYFEGNNASATAYDVDADGGAIALTGYNATIIDTISADFVGNYVHVTASTGSWYDLSGGAIFLASDGDNGYSCNYIGGTAEDYSLFKENYVIQETSGYTSAEHSNANGGAIRNDSMWIETIQYCDFTDNYVSSPNSAYGGAISNYDSDGQGEIIRGIGQIADANFTGNKAIDSKSSNGDYGYGGAIYNNMTIDEIVRTKFTANEATHGGAIYNDGYISIENAYFVDNIASVAGGAIYNGSDGTMDIIDTDSSTTFSGNEAAGSSNAIHNDGTIKLYALNGNSMVFNESITGSGSMTINNTSEMSDSNGNIVLNDNMSGYTGSVTVYNGTITVGANMGKTGDYTNFFDGEFTVAATPSISSFSIKDGATTSYSPATTLDAGNGVLDKFDLTKWDTSAGMGLVLDVDLSSQTADFFDNAGSEQYIIIESFVLLGDLDQESAYIYISDASAGFYIASDVEEIVSDQYSYTISAVYFENNGDYEDGFYLHFEQVIIPEPSTATLSILALCGLCARRRRKAA